MPNWLQVVIALPIALLIVAGLWKVSVALTRRGIVVRPVDVVDDTMTKIERRFANPEANNPKLPKPPVA